jgi:hypothetical protein
MPTGTGFFTTIPGTSVMAAQSDEARDYMFVKCATGDIPSATAGYGTGCLLIDTTTGYLWTNQGSDTSCSFVVVT